MPEITVRLQALNGVWETCGIDRLRGIVAEDVNLTANEWGSDTCRFVLKRLIGSASPDLGAFTPCDVEVDGRLVWSGRVWETPTKTGGEGSISVEGRGWQYHLDDDVYSRAYVHTRLTDWRDVRSLPTAPLGYYTQFGNVQVGDGAISMGWANGTTVPSNHWVGATLDLGPGSEAKRIVVHYDTTSAWSGFRLEAQAHAAPEPLRGGSPNVAIDVAMTTVSPQAGTFPTSQRYVTISLYANGTQGPVGGDTAMRFLRVQVFTDTAYESANESVLKAETIVKDARNKATQLLSTSDSKIAVTTFSIPSFGTDGPKTPREAINAANAYNGLRTRVTVNRELEYGGVSSTPKFEVGTWAGTEFEDTSANSAEEIYNACLVVGVGPDGAPLEVETISADVGTLVVPETVIVADNPSADVDTASWTATAGTISRDTTTFHTSPASINWQNTTLNAYLQETFTGTFKAGVSYQLRFKFRPTTGYPNKPNYEFQFGDIAAGDYATITKLITVESFNSFAVTWIPNVDRSAALLRVKSVQNPTGGWIDSLGLFTAAQTLVDRRGFKRTKILPVDVDITQGIGERIGSIWLTKHVTTPLKGNLVVSSPGGVRTLPGPAAFGTPAGRGPGADVHPAHILLETGEKIRFTHIIDPDTGAWSRDGTIASVSWDGATNKASVAIDNERKNFEALLARLAVVVGR